MGTGLDAARLASPEHADLIDSLDNMRDQLLIVFLKRLGGSVSIPVAEMDDTGDDLFCFDIDGQTFDFHLRKKS